MRGATGKASIITPAFASWRMAFWSLNDYVADVKKTSLLPEPSLSPGYRPRNAPSDM